MISFRQAVVTNNGLTMKLKPMKTDFPVQSSEQQEEAWQYVCKRKLQRPDTNIFTAAKCAMAFVVIVVFLSFFTFSFFMQIISVSPQMAFMESFCLYTMFGFMVFSKKLTIGLVRLYQHYAPERIRRKCLFKPTCSEYIILAIEKYGLIKGLYKGLYRVFFRCRGFVYYIDYP
jgi:putative component of membrane protein insertase Oxa1/YidC/SpoIIIJ protein YidD